MGMDLKETCPCCEFVLYVSSEVGSGVELHSHATAVCRRLGSLRHTSFNAVAIGSLIQFATAHICAEYLFKVILKHVLVCLCLLQDMTNRYRVDSPCCMTHERMSMQGFDC